MTTVQVSKNGAVQGRKPNGEYDRTLSSAPEVDVDLSTGDSLADEGAPSRRFPWDDGEHHWDDPEWTRAINDQMVKYAKMYAHRYGAGQQQSEEQAEDFAQGALMEMITEHKRGKRHNDIPNAARTKVMALATRAGGRMRAEDRRASNNLKVKIRAFEQEHNRAITEPERRVLIDQVMKEWHDPRHKPNRDTLIHGLNNGGREMTMTEYEGRTGAADGEGRTLADTVDGDLNRDDLSVEVGSWASIAIIASNKDSEEASTANAKLVAYAAVAEMRGAPVPEPASVPYATIDKARQVMKDGEDGNHVARAIATWNSGEDDERTDALFAPFGSIDEGERDEVCNMLSRSPGQAYDLWLSAASFANKRSAKRLAPLIARYRAGA